MGIALVLIEIIMVSTGTVCEGFWWDVIELMGTKRTKTNPIMPKTHCTLL